MSIIPQALSPAVGGTAFVSAPWKVILQDEYLKCCEDPMTVVLSAISPCCQAGCISSEINRNCLCSALCYAVGCWSCHRAEVQRALQAQESSCIANCVLNAPFGCCICSFPQSKRAIASYKQYSGGMIVAVPAQPSTVYPMR